MSRAATWIRRHPLATGFAVAVVPVVLLLGLQLSWLTRLEHATRLADELAMRNFIDAVGAEVEGFYRSTAERLLDVPATLLEDGDLDGVAAFWAEEPMVGARRLFVADFTRLTTGNFYFYDPDTASLGSTTASDESLAVVLATLPWPMRAGGAPRGVQVDEQDAAHRLVLRPIVAGEHTLGIAGMIVDADHHRTRLLPDTIDRTLPGFFAPEVREHVTIRVVDEAGRAVFGPAEAVVGAVLAEPFPFVFSDWTMRVARDGSPSAMRSAFALNMALGLLLSGVLLGGVGFALRAADRAVRLSQMKSDFVSNVSHELRTPLASIRVFAELLSLGKADSPEKVKQYGDHIEAEGRRLSRLIDNILDFSRIENQQRAYTFHPTDVAELVEAVCESLDDGIERAGHRLRVERPGVGEAVVEADADAITQALHNLIDNATKYSDAPSEIVVSVRREREAVAIAVHDQGRGIPRAEQRKIFDRFHRVGTGLVHDVGGSGLGLAIVDHVVTAHGGRVEVRSEPGGGSTFTILLPAPSRA